MPTAPDTAELARQFLIPSTATLTSALRKYGLTNTYLHQVAPLRPGMKMAGPAFTLRYIPAREDLNAGEVDNLRDAQRVAIEQLPPGQVFAIDARGDTRAGTMGAILATRLHQRGAAGIVTDGAYRDSPVIAELGLPAYAAAMNAHANKTIHHPSEFQVPIACGGVAIIPGDWLVGDSEGVVVVPAHLAAAVAREALEQEEKEDFIMEKIRSGASIVGTYPPDAQTLEEFARWKERRR
ncbi:MAG: ribonuclease activity regulator RraA [Candidatus Latescibacteria bacterium]|nr:ribonuclease activity regulator RraA [Candidatus Latescibacterota bacterium]